MEIILPEDVKRIIETLSKAGFEAYAVGGCVRDCLLGKQPNDWDITTSALPKEVKSLFRRTIDTGIAHGTVTVMMNHTGYEVTTYRIDGEYEDGRHPKQVSFTRSLREDLRRRDFTINAMAYNEQDGLVDLFEGQQDLQNGVIRCVGEAEERFGEDALRMLRAVRFAAQLGFSLDPATASAIRELAPTLSKVSAERIQTELVKTLVSGHPERIRDAYEYGLTAVFLPEFDRMMDTKQNNINHIYSVGEHTIQSMYNIRADKVLRLTMLFHDIGKPLCKTTDEDGMDHFHGHPELSANLAKECLRRLKFDNETIERVYRLCKCHDYRIEPERKYLRRAMRKLGADLFPDFFEVQRADVLAQSDYKRTEKLDQITHNEADFREIQGKSECVSLHDLAVNGSDLIGLGIRPGKQIGELLNLMLDEVVENPENNDKYYLLQVMLPKNLEKWEKIGKK